MVEVKAKRWTNLNDSIMLRASARAAGGPTRVPTSKYQAFRAKLGTSDLIFSRRGWRVNWSCSGLMDEHSSCKKVNGFEICSSLSSVACYMSML